GPPLRAQQQLDRAELVQRPVTHHLSARKTKSDPLKTLPGAACEARCELPLLGSNQDSPDPESGVLPVTPRGSGAEGARTPDLLGAIQALSQLSYSPAAPKT